MTSHPDERAAAMVETSEEITEHHTGTTPAPTGRQRPAGGRISKWMIEEQPNGLHRCEVHFVDPVRAWGRALRSEVDMGAEQPRGGRVDAVAVAAASTSRHTRRSGRFRRKS